MNCYGKVILYIYPALEEVSAQIDELVRRRALASFSDTSDCAAQAERIIGYIHQKDLLMELKLGVDAVLEKFSEEDVKYFEYKYFQEKAEELFRGFDAAGGDIQKADKTLRRVLRTAGKRGFTESRSKGIICPWISCAISCGGWSAAKERLRNLPVRRRKTAVGAKAGAGAE